MARVHKSQWTWITQYAQTSHRVRDLILKMQVINIFGVKYLCDIQIIQVWEKDSCTMFEDKSAQILL